MAEKKLNEVFEDIKTIADMGMFEDWEAEDYGIESDEGFPFYASVKSGYLLSIVHIDGDWSGAIYGNGYGDCYCFDYADSAEDALEKTLVAASSIDIN